jgi:hypothetical protein
VDPGNCPSPVYQSVLMAGVALQRAFDSLLSISSGNLARDDGGQDEMCEAHGL